MEMVPLPLPPLSEAQRAQAPEKPWFTVIEDDASRCIACFRLSFQKAIALTTALCSRQGDLVQRRAPLADLWHPERLLH